MPVNTNTNTPDELADYIAKKDFSFTPHCPITDSELSHIFKNRRYNGFKDAFVKFSARGFLVHVPTFLEVLGSKRGM